MNLVSITTGIIDYISSSLEIFIWTLNVTAWTVSNVSIVPKQIRVTDDHRTSSLPNKKFFVRRQIYSSLLNRSILFASFCVFLCHCLRSLLAFESDVEFAYSVLALFFNNERLELSIYVRKLKYTEIGHGQPIRDSNFG